MDRSTFSQAQRGQKGISAEKNAALYAFLKAEVDKLTANARVDSNEGATARAAAASFNQLFSRSEEHRDHRYVSPGGILPADASNYVVRSCDNDLEHIVSSSANAVAVVGGPRTGKSSVLRRLADVATRNHRPVRTANLGDALARARQSAGSADGKLSLPDIAAQVAFAITNDATRPLKTGPETKFLIQMVQERFIELMSRPGLGEQIVVLDGFNEIVDYARDLSDVTAIVQCLFSHTLRRDRMMIVLPDDGLCAASDAVSEAVSRCWQLSTRQLSIYDVEALTKQVLGDETEIARGVITEMIDAFGDFIFLHHVALDRMKATKIPANELNTTLPMAISDILESLSGGKEDWNISDPIQRELARFGTKVARRLRQIQGPPTKNPQDGLIYALANVDDPNVSISPNYILRRQLSWTGFLPEGKSLPRFVRAIARSLERAP